MSYYLDIPIEFPGGVKKMYDLIVPEGNPATKPLLVWIHGGGWVEGEKRIGNEFERFIYRGYAVLSIDYRFAQDAPFPAQLSDCKYAIRWARANAEKYGYNSDCIVVGGGSAGGHLASLVGLTNGMKEFDTEGGYQEYSSDVQGVYDGYGPSDLSDLPAFNHIFEKMFKNDTKSFDEMAKYASPISYASANAPIFYIAHGTVDSCIPVGHSRRLFEALEKAGAKVSYYEEPTGEHGFDSLEHYIKLTEFIEKNFPSGR